MKILLRSTFLATATDTKDKDLILRNYHHLCETGLSFDVDEDIPIWKFIQDFVQAHNHCPEATTLKSHFTARGETQVVGRLDGLCSLPCIMGGDFITRLTDKAEDRRVRVVSELLKEAATIVQTGMEVKEGRKSKILKGPQDAVRYILDKSHAVVTPTLGARLSGEVTRDGSDFKREYELIESDPLAGIGQHVGLDQFDAALNGARRYELWVHAAFSGHLKCLAGDARIWDLNTGRYRTAKEICQSKETLKVHALDEQSWKMTLADTSPAVESGEREIFKVTAKSGLSTRVSGNHPFRTPDGWVDANQLKVGDWVALPCILPNTQDHSPFSDSEVALLGYLIGDGSIVNYIDFANKCQERINDFANHLDSMGYLETRGRVKARFPSYRRTRGGIRVSHSTGNSPRHPWGSPLRDLLDRLGLYGHNAHTKFIPNDLWGMPDRQVWILLSSLWATDGSIKTIHRVRKGRKDIDQVNVYYASASKRLVSDIQLLLQRVGVYSVLHKSVIRYKGEPRTYWSVTPTNSQAKKHFLIHCKPVGKEADVERALSALQGCPDGDDVFPVSFADAIPDDVRFQTEAGNWRYVRWIKKNPTLHRKTLADLAKITQDNHLSKIVQGNVRWEQIDSITSDGVEMTYDLSVPGHANFVVDGFITHNSTLMVNWAYNQAVWYYHSSCIFELEMPYQQCRRLIYALHSCHEKFRTIRLHLGLQKDPNATVGLPYEHIRDGTLHEYHTNAREFLFDYVIPDLNGTKVVTGINPNTGEEWDDPKNYGKIYIEVQDPDKPDFTVANLRQRAELIYSKTPFRMIFIDHAGLMAPRNYVPSTTERLNEVLRDLKRLAMAFNRGHGIAVVAMFQMSRDGFRSALKIKEKTGQARYELIHLSYANEAERSADVVTCGWKDDDLVKLNRVQFQCLKSRDQKPFEICQARVEWPTRRLLTCDDVIMSEPEKQAAGRRIDKNQQSAVDLADLG